MKRPRVLPTLLAVLCLLAPAAARADEGMWTLDNLPADSLQARYGFRPTPAWIEHVRLGSVRINDGGSGSFVSPRGLVLTNHHVAITQLQKMSSAEHDYVRDGFFARTEGEEIRCPDVELNQLVSMENVTERVRRAVGTSGDEAARAARRRAAIAALERESHRRTGLRSDVVELYQGGEYWLYRYRKYTDLRLVMAPEVQAANFGGDPDNFTYPRHDFDVAFFRVYENGRPLDSSRFYFPWDPQGAGDGEFVVVPGHPGNTDRLLTLAQLEVRRAVELPEYLASRRAMLEALRAYAARGPEQARRAESRILGHENSIKARLGYLTELRRPERMREMAARESTFRARVGADPRLTALAGDAWTRLAELQRERARRLPQLLAYRVGYSHPSELAALAHGVVRYAIETAKPNDRRLAEYRESALESMRLDLLSPAPVYPDLEEAVLAADLEYAARRLGPEDPWVQAALQGRPAAEVARELVAGTKLADVAERQRLLAGGLAAVQASRDPLVQWALRVDRPYRETRAWVEDVAGAIEATEGGRLAQARFAAYGRSAYPDATFTLRLSFGRVAGYDQGTNVVPYKTTIGSLYARSAEFDRKPPFDLGAAWAEHRDDVDPDTPLDFVSTNDIIGGNSGSPVLDRDLKLVGVIFDGNMQGMVLDFLYDDEQARAVSVHSAGILEGLRRVYGMEALARELTGGTLP